MFEYKILHADGFVVEQELNILGKERWELTGVVPDKDSDSYDYIFKRMVNPVFINGLPREAVLNSIPVNRPTLKQVEDVFKNAKI